MLWSDEQLWGALHNADEWDKVEGLAFSMRDEYEAHIKELEDLVSVRQYRIESLENDLQQVWERYHKMEARHSDMESATRVAHQHDKARIKELEAQVSKMSEVHQVELEQMIPLNPEEHDSAKLCKAYARIAELEAQAKQIEKDREVVALALQLYKTLAEKFAEAVDKNNV